ncbi:MAG: hypothetical protein M0R40_00495 [Firmicutes bacterium]|nr:hypothetical protein [Bacillota bacterium]
MKSLKTLIDEYISANKATQKIVDEIDKKYDVCIVDPDKQVHIVGYYGNEEWEKVKEAYGVAETEFIGRNDTAYKTKESFVVNGVEFLRLLKEDPREEQNDE